MPAPLKQHDVRTPCCSQASASTAGRRADASAALLQLARERGPVITRQRTLQQATPGQQQQKQQEQRRPGSPGRKHTRAAGPRRRSSGARATRVSDEDGGVPAAQPEPAPLPQPQPVGDMPESGVHVPLSANPVPELIVRVKLQGVAKATVGALSKEMAEVQKHAAAIRKVGRAMRVSINRQCV